MHSKTKNPDMDKLNNIGVQRLIDSIDDIVAITDATNKVLLLNKTARKLLLELALLQPDNLIGHKIDAVLAPMIHDGVSVVAMAVKAKKPIQKNIRYLVQNKDISIDKTLLYSCMPLMENDELQYVVTIGRDMTKLIQLEERLVASEKLNKYYYSALATGYAEEEFTSPMVISSKKMEDAITLASKASQSDASVFITGESGVGKEEFAKFIHRNSPRKDKPFVTINCAVLPENLIESELFGYVDGAFTGSRKEGKKGIVEEANGGTLFLDEIAELPLALQSKLLRVVQDGSFRAIGGTDDKMVDVRYISATNVPLEQLLDNAVFRQDLLYRLSVVPITIAPLRERKEDIIPLVERFLNFFNAKYNRGIQLTAAAYNCLCAQPWRGNVRQLKNVVERIVILSEDRALLKEDLLPILQLDIDCAEPIDKETPVVVNKLTTFADALTQTENQLIEMALEKYETVPKAAKALDIAPSTIYRKLKNEQLSDAPSNAI